MAEVRFESVSKQYPNGFRAVVDLDLEVADGELLVVVGPSGCGKSTTLRMLAGLEDISDGKIWIGDECVNEIEARRRNIAMVFQSYALYPHLTVGGNLAYPLKVAGMPKAERDARVREVASVLRLTDMLDRKPRLLSGGQRQRVAMGRAMVREPEVFLMDEPLSNLDAKLRVQMRAEVSELQRTLGATMFYVTHDQVEAMTMGDRVAVMNEGLLQQVATPSDLYAKPANAFVAGFIGSPPMNRLVARLRTSGDQHVVASGEQDITALSGEFAQLAERASGHDSFILGVRPEHLEIVPRGEGVSMQVRLVEHLGSEQIVHLDATGFELYTSDRSAAEEDATQRLLVNVRSDDLGVASGDTIDVRVAGRHLHVFDGATGAAIEA
jgi:multiple sugar transport system ATP-binding protein